MNAILSRISAVAVAGLFALGAIAPVNALPINALPGAASASSNVLLVKDHHKFRKHGNYAYFNNHRGYRHHHHGYRYYNGFWFPPAAFITGVIIGGALSTSSDPHVRWCYNHYRSYRASDNTFQPLHGPRRACVSPYH